tara:strand:- start:969 stop:1436 length:468 start_codon:yes stop_codon:yes gene_type:complete
MEIVPHDPIYNAITVGLQVPGAQPDITDIDNTRIVISRVINERFSAVKIKERVDNIFKQVFATGNAELGQTINISDISAEILAIPGVQSITTRLIDANNNIIREVPFLNLYSFNVIYSDVDIESTSSNITLPYFKYPFLYNATLSDRIIVETVNI